MSRRKCTSIDTVLSGQRIRNIMVKNGYSVEELRESLYMSCPQTIYRWFWGEAVPSVDNLYVMSKLFGIHMEDMLVERKSVPITHESALNEKTRIKKQIIKIIDEDMYMLLDNVDIKFLEKLYAIICDIKKNKKDNSNT